jgi:hypothetical protein
MTNDSSVLHKIWETVIELIKLHVTEDRLRRNRGTPMMFLYKFSLRARSRRLASEQTNLTYCRAKIYSSCCTVYANGVFAH